MEVDKQTARPLTWYESDGTENTQDVGKDYIIMVATTESDAELEFDDERGEWYSNNDLSVSHGFDDDYGNSPIPSDELTDPLDITSDGNDDEVSEDILRDVEDGKLDEEYDLTD
jgi:hypothetical protein